MTIRSKPVKLAIVGGGAGGLFAAAVAAERHIPCVLIERKARLGSKVLMTANGRCNFTKDISAEQFIRDVGAAGDFVAEAIRECPPRQIISGFKSLHVPLRRMPDGRMFPADGKAATIVHAFGDLLRDCEVPILTNCPVKGIEKAKAGDEVKVKGEGEHRTARFLVRTRNFDLEAENVLLATGGISYPKLGSVGDGQNFAKALGHHLVPYQPGLIGLETNDRRVTSLAGQRFEDGRVKVFESPHVPHSLTRSDSKAGLSVFESPHVPHSLARSDSKAGLLFDYRGEVDCESFGLSGAAIYNAQRFIAHWIKDGRRTTDDAAALTVEVWFGHNRLQFQGLNPRPVKEAIVTIGGVDTREINPHTMESRLVPHLYFAGEVMDIDGPTGGYNLTLAFATARKAVTSIR